MDLLSDILEGQSTPELYVSIYRFVIYAFRQNKTEVFVMCEFILGGCLVLLQLGYHLSVSTLLTAFSHKKIVLAFEVFEVVLQVLEQEQQESSSMLFVDRLCLAEQFAQTVEELGD